MEQKDFDGCIATCKKGIEKGREAKVDYKLIARSFMRIGNAYKKQGKLEDAIRAYEDSLMEDRSEEVEKLLKQTRALKKKVALCVRPGPGARGCTLLPQAPPDVRYLSVFPLAASLTRYATPLRRPTKRRIVHRSRPRRRVKRAMSSSRPATMRPRWRCTPKP
jgi:tetratricopeptide (TPR) repeat protein